MNDLNKTTKNVKAVITKLDDLDQETLVSMLAMTNDIDTADDCEPSAILDNSKEQVITFISAIKDLADSQSQMIDSLKTWFASLKENNSFLREEESQQTPEPNKNEIFQQIEDIINNASIKAEKLAYLHSDVCDYFLKQTNSYKKLISTKDDQIKKLSDEIEAAKAAKAKKDKIRQKAQKNEAKDLEIQKTQLSNALRLIEEQKNQVESLKIQLQTTNIEKTVPVANVYTPPQNSFQNQDSIQNEANLSQLKIETDAKMALLNERIAILSEENKKLTKQAQYERENVKQLNKEIQETKNYSHELEASLQKNIKLLALEKEKNESLSNNIPPPENIADEKQMSEETALELLKAKNEIRELQEKHRIELINQADILRAKFLIEKEKLLNAISNDDQNSLQMTLKNMMAEYEDKMKTQKEEYEKAKISIIKGFGAKLDILTRQYENRISTINTNHEMDMIIVQKSKQYEVSKSKLELEEVYSNELAAAKNEKDSVQVSLQIEIERLNDSLFQAQSQISAMKNAFSSIAIEFPETKTEIQKLTQTINTFSDSTTSLPKPNLEKSTSSISTNINIFNSQNEAKLYEQYKQRFIEMKNELEEQKLWELKQQKKFYEDLLDKKTLNHQKEMRDILLQTNDSISDIIVDGENPINLAHALGLLSSFYKQLNSQIETQELTQNILKDTENENEDEKTLNESDSTKELSPFAENNSIPKEETIPLQEAISRNEVLLEKLTQYENSKNESNLIKNNDSETINNLELKIKYLESLIKGDQNSATINFKKYEEDMKDQINFKDVCINDLKQQIACLENGLSKNVLELEFQQWVLFDLEPPPSMSINDSVVSDVMMRSSPNFFQDTNSAVRKASEISEQNNPLVRYGNASNINLNEQNISVTTFEEKNQKQDLPVTLVVSNPTSKTSIISNEIRKRDSLTNTSNSSDSKIQNPSSDESQFKARTVVRTSVRPLGGFKQKIPTVNKEIQVELTQTQNHKSTEPNLEKSQESINEPINKSINEPIPVDSKRVEMLTISSPYSTQIPVNFVETPPVPKKVIQVAKGRNISIEEIVGIPPQEPPIPKILFADEIELKEIEKLESKILSSRSIENGSSNSSQVYENESILSSNPTENDSDIKDNDESDTKKNNNEINNIPEIFKLIKKQKKMITKLQDVIRDLESRKPEIITLHDIPLDDTPKMIYPTERFNPNDPSIPKAGKRRTKFIAKESSPTTQPEIVPDPNVAESQPMFLNSTRQHSNFVQSVRTIPPPVYDRPSPTPIYINTNETILADNMIEDAIIEDPFSAAITQLASNIQFTKSFQDNEQWIKTTLQNDISAYQSFLQATDNGEPAHYSFIKQLVDSERCFDQNNEKLSEFIQKEISLMDILKICKKQAKQISAALIETQNNLITQELAAQQKMINVSDKSSYGTLIQLRQIGIGLDLIEQLQIPLSNESEKMMSAIKERYIKLNQTKKPSPSDIGKLAENLHDFMESIKPNSNNKNLKEEGKLDENSDSTIVTVRKTVAISELKELKGRIKHLEESREKILKENKTNLEQVNNLKSTISTLTNRLSNEKETNESSLSLYKAQIDTLRDVLSKLTNSSPAESKTMNIAEQVKNQILSLQSMLDMAISERDSQRAKIEEIEDEYLQQSTEYDHLQHEFEELVRVNKDLQDQVKSHKESMMFHENDIQKLKDEIEADNLVSMKNRGQLEAVLAENSNLHEKIIKLEDNNKQLRKQLRVSEEAIDDLQVKAALGLLAPPKPSTFEAATQTVFRAVIVQKKKAPPPKKKEEVNQKVEIPDQEKPKEIPVSVIVKEDTPTEQETKQEITEDTPISNEEANQIVEEVHQDKKEEETTSQETLTPEPDLEEDTEEEVAWEKTEDDTFDADNFGAELTKQPSSEIIHVFGLSNSELGEEVAPEIVHSPLQWQKKKPTFRDVAKRLVTRPKTATKPSLHLNSNMFNAFGFNQGPSKFHQDSSNLDDLNIGGAINGQRPLSGTHTRIRPTTNSRAAILSRISGVLHPTELLPLDSQHINIPHPPATLRPLVPSSPPSKESESLFDINTETIRITRVKYEPPEGQVRCDGRPIVQERPKTSISQSGAVLPPSIPKIDVGKLKKMINKLRDQISKLQEEIDDKEENANAIKRKQAETQRLLQRAQVERVRAEDKARRAEIRHEDVRSRLEIAMKELGKKEDEVNKLKNAILKLKIATSGAKDIFNNLKQKDAENGILQRELARRKRMAEAQEKAIAALSEATAANENPNKTSLERLLENTRRSVTRLEARKKLWLEEERKQAYNALAALSLVSEKNEIVEEATKMVSVYNKARLNRLHNLWSQRKELGEERKLEENEMIKIVDEPNDEKVYNTISSQSMMIEVMDKIIPPLTLEEKRMVIRGELTGDLSQKFENYFSQVPHPKSLENEVIVPETQNVKS